MRFRSIGICASNKKDYLSFIKEVENNYINESILAHIGFISLEETNNITQLLGPNSIYKLSKLKTKRKRRKFVKIQNYRKKRYFKNQTKIKRSNNNNSINLINN